jgi:hypothetical protein
MAPESILVPALGCSLMTVHSILKIEEQELRRCLIHILKRFLLSSCAWMLLFTAAAAQSAQRPFQSGEHVPSSSERNNDAVPATPSDYRRISAGGRLEWFTQATVGGPSLAGGLFSSALGTATDSPSEYGPHWDGFAKRYGMRLTGVSTGNAIEAVSGAAFGEDPRYFHTVHDPFGSRVKNVVDMTFRAYHADGERHLAYGRYAATLGNNFLSNTWRAESEADWQHALLRTAEGFGSRAISNAFHEFVPQVWRKIRHKPDPFPSDIQNP